MRCLPAELLAPAGIQGGITTLAALHSPGRFSFHTHSKAITHAKHVLGLPAPGRPGPSWPSGWDPTGGIPPAGIRQPPPTGSDFPTAKRCDCGRERCQ